MHKFAFLCGVALAISLILPMVADAAPMNFTVNMSEPVVVNTTNGTPSIALTVGDQTRAATYSGGSGTPALTFSYSPQPGDYDMDGVAVVSPVTLNGGTIRDNAANPATLTFTPPVTSGVKVDYASLLMDFAGGSYRLGAISYNSFVSFLTAAGGTFTRNSIGTCFDASGVLRTASADTPRFDHDPDTHAAKGLLIEGGSTNFLRYSETMDNTVWTRSGGTVTVNAMAAPDSQTAADLVSDVTYIMQTNSVSAEVDEIYTFSVWLKTASGTVSTSIYIEVNVSGQSNYRIATRSITITSQWQRFTLTGTVPLGYASSLRPSVRNGTYYMWGAQFERGAFATSYIPTGGSAVTRVADTFTIPVGAWYNQTAGTAVEDVSYVSSAGTGWPMLWQFIGAANDRWNMYYNQNTN